MRRWFWGLSLLVLALIELSAREFPDIRVVYVVVVPIILVGVHDVLQRRHAILHNFPVIGHFRYLLESIRPELQQYFVESDLNGVPLPRRLRSVVYQRATNTQETTPFGTKYHVYDRGYEWVKHSLLPVECSPANLRVRVGGEQCQKPYNASVLNISAMSYGALSPHAILALNGGAKLGGFAHNTGEGGLSPYHLKPGGDIFWQIGTGYFGCRTPDGNFDAEKFAKQSTDDAVKMIEIKLSQGAKPGHGGVLPGSKVTQEIADIRHIPVGKDCLSPPAHKAFSTPEGLLHFVAQLRQLSGGKPIGFKLCVGRWYEFIAICKAMIKTDITPDFITVDGGEGGTGAGPLEFVDFIGSPLTDALYFVHNTLVGYSLRHRMKLICSGRVLTAFDMVKRMAQGADMCNSARGMMLSLGCIQAYKCNTNTCPTGVATANPKLYKGLNVALKTQRVANFHENTLLALSEMLGAMGLDSPMHLSPVHVMRRISEHEAKSLAQLRPYLNDGDILNRRAGHPWVDYEKMAGAESFRDISSDDFQRHHDVVGATGHPSQTSYQHQGVGRFKNYVSE